MHAKSDTELLRDYAERGAENAFAEIVHRHTNLVYSVALRLVNLPETAAEVAQTVFVSLAQGARSLWPRLRPDASLAGWLCRSARNVSLNLQRNEFRRRAREKLAMEQLDPTSGTDPEWDRLRPVVDEIMSELPEPDYDALVLRFFREQDFVSVGRALGVSDDAAQKRVSRALDKMRDLLSQRGITMTAAALAILLTANAVQTAPVGLAATISSAATLTATTVATTATAIKVLTMITLQKTLIVTMIAAGVATPMVMQYRAQAKLREENQLLRQQVDQLTPLGAENERLSKLIAEARQSKPPPSQPSRELLRLRGELGRLRQQNQDLAKLVADRQPSPAAFQPSSTWADAGSATPEAAAGTFAWAIKSGNTDKLAEVLMLEADPASTNAAAFVGDISKGLQPLFAAIESSRLVFTENTAPDEETLWFQSQFNDGHTLFSPLTLKRIGDQWKVMFVEGDGVVE
ncbi:MAG: RNA polymerase sigma factor [Limisphaerales bacterium]